MLSGRQKLQGRAAHYFRYCLRGRGVVAAERCWGSTSRNGGGDDDARRQHLARKTRRAKRGASVQEVAGQYAQCKDRRKKGTQGKRGRKQTGNTGDSSAEANVKSKSGVRRTKDPSTPGRTSFFFFFWQASSLVFFLALATGATVAALTHYSDLQGILPLTRPLQARNSVRPPRATKITGWRPSLRPAFATTWRYALAGLEQD